MIELKAAGQWEIVNLKAGTPEVFYFTPQPSIVKRIPPPNAGWFTVYFAVNPNSPGGGNDAGVQVEVEVNGEVQKTNTRQGRVGFKLEDGTQHFAVTAAKDVNATVIWYYGRIGLPRVKK